MSLKTVRRKYIYRSFNLIVILMIVSYLILNIIRINDNVKTQGTIKSKSIMYIKSPCDTYLKEIYVVPGEEVKPGQLLAKLDDYGIRNYLQNLKADLIASENRKTALFNEMHAIPNQISNLEQDIVQSKVKIAYAQSLYESNLKLYQNGAISFLEMKNSQQNYESLKNDLQKYETNLKVYKLQNQDTFAKDTEEIRSLDAKMTRLRKQLSSLETQFMDFDGNAGSPSIIAPCAGVITAIGDEESSDTDNSTTKQVDSYIGKTFGVNQTIFEISDPKNIYIESAVSETNFPFVFEGDKVSITFPAYPYAQFGVLTGILEKLHKEPTNMAGSTVYKCEIKIVNINTNKDIKAYLGLSTSNVIDSKTNYSLFDYMIKKVFKEK